MHGCTIVHPCIQGTRACIRNTAPRRARCMLSPSPRSLGLTLQPAKTLGSPIGTSDSAHLYGHSNYNSQLTEFCSVTPKVLVANNINQRVIVQALLEARNETESDATTKKEQVNPHARDHCRPRAQPCCAAASDGVRANALKAAGTPRALRPQVLLSNRSRAFLEMGQLDQALMDANSAVEADPTWWKALYRRCMALTELADDGASAV